MLVNQRATDVHPKKNNGKPETVHWSLSYNPIPKTTISPDHLKYTSHLCGQMQDERKP